MVEGGRDGGVEGGGVAGGERSKEEVGKSLGGGGVEEG